MAPSTGRHDADGSATDRARIDYLAGDLHGELDPAERAELDELRDLLADPTLWAEPPADLEDSVVALIAAEAQPLASTPVDPADLDADQQTPLSPVDGKPVNDNPAGTSAVVTNTGPAADVRRTAAGPDGTVDFAAARQRKEQGAGRRRFTRPAFLVAAAAAVVAVGLSAVLLLRDSTSERRYDVALAATDVIPGASGNASMVQRESGWEIQLDATGLPRLDNGRFYQAWLRSPEGVLVPIGTFNEGADVVLWAGVNPANFSTFTVTEESADGVQDSSGVRVLVGTAVER